MEQEAAGYFKHYFFGCISVTQAHIITEDVRFLEQCSLSFNSLTFFLALTKHFFMQNEVTHVS